MPKNKAKGMPNMSESAQSIEMVLATETGVEVYDWRINGMVKEVLLMSGLRSTECPIPLLDMQPDELCLLRTPLEDYGIGHVKDLRIVGGKLVGMVICEKSKKGFIQEVFGITKFYKAHLVKKGESVAIHGREFEGPLKVVSDWSIDGALLQKPLASSPSAIEAQDDAKK